MGYADDIRRHETALAEAKRALGSDLAAAIKHAPWRAKLNDVHDIRAMVDKIGELAQEASFFAAIHATAERARNAQKGKRGRGRPKKAESAAKAVKPVKAAAPVQVKTDEAMMEA